MTFGFCNFLVRRLLGCKSETCCSKRASFCRRHHSMISWIPELVTFLLLIIRPTQNLAHCDKSMICTDSSEPLCRRRRGTHAGGTLVLQAYCHTYKPRLSTSEIKPVIFISNSTTAQLLVMYVLEYSNICTKPPKSQSHCLCQCTHQITAPELDLPARIN